ncbi:MAG: hypothetical protein M5U15_13690 [Kiritimatiellae bacterium]|nr:hypothetical protein [Kiritimatiellia bacterium]
MRFGSAPSGSDASSTWKAFLSSNFLNWPMLAPTETVGAMNSATALARSWAMPFA